ncbi:F0F1 ATP synthase subunit I [Actinobacillus equuli]|nr:F0F1 ATP synthase subunit I [Actinobacillus equuli]
MVGLLIVWKGVDSISFLGGALSSFSLIVSLFIGFFQKTTKISQEWAIFTVVKD